MVIITDLLGNKLMETNYSRTEGINVTRLNTGFYLYKIMTKDGNSYTGKIVKE